MRMGYIQRGTDHEIGHMLGLPHPNGGYGTDSSEYGDNHNERGNVMGIGHVVRQEDYRWATRIMRAANPRYTWQLAPARSRNTSREQCQTHATATNSVRSRSPRRFDARMV